MNDPTETDLQPAQGLDGDSEAAPIVGADTDGAASSFQNQIIHGLPFEDYLKIDGVSKSTLWTGYTRSWAHARVEKEESNVMKIGSAVHCAILEPDEFSDRYIKGPADRRGLKWTEPLEEAKAEGKELLTSGDYEKALLIRDKAQAEPLIKKLTGVGTVRELTCHWVDPITGLKMRARPDAYSPAIELVSDVKITTDARQIPWVRNAVTPFGYNAQEVQYTEGMRACGEGVNAFVFIVIERDPPFEFIVHELIPRTVEEGRRKLYIAREEYARCVEEDRWPGYPREIQQTGLNRYDYELTTDEEFE
ncbi:MAG: PD-(D/E)XK nuclease-like domain-containing protein [Pseudomonadota bacterium]